MKLSNNHTARDRNLINTTSQRATPDRRVRGRSSQSALLTKYRKGEFTPPEPDATIRLVCWRLVLARESAYKLQRIHVYIKVRYTLDIAPLRETPPQKRSGMARVLKGSHTVLPAHLHVYPQAD